MEKNAFFKGFEKKGHMYSSKIAPKVFNELVHRTALNRAKNMGLSVVPHSSEGVPFSTKIVARFADKIRGKPKGHMENLLSEGIKMRPSHYSGGKDVVVNPDNLLGALGSMAGKKLPPSARGVMTHHELDEAELYKKFKLAPWKTRLHQNIQDVKHIFKKGIKPHLLDKIRGDYIPTLGAKGIASHVSPEVLLRESNRVFHESTPAVQKAMKALRQANNEAHTLKAHGLRYGDEYIPEGGRRWRKLVKKLEGQQLLKPKARHNV